MKPAKTKTYRPCTASRTRLVQRVTVNGQPPFYVASFHSVGAFIGSVTPDAAERPILRAYYHAWSSVVDGAPDVRNISWVLGGAGYPTTFAALLASVRCATRTPEKIRAAFDETREAIRTRVGTLKRSAATLRRSRCYRIDDGAEIDVDRMLAGSPDIWRSRTRGKKRPTVTLAVQLGQTSDGTPETYARIIAITAAAVEVIESAGVAVKVLGCYGAVRLGPAENHDVHNASHPSPGPSTPCMVSFPLKGTEEPVNVSRLLAFGQPGAHRTLGFAARALLYGCGDGMGSSWVPPDPHPIRAYLGVDHWIGRAPKNGQQVETLEGILRNTIPGAL